MRIDEEARYQLELRARQDPLVQLIDAKIAALAAFREAYLPVFALGLRFDGSPQKVEPEQAAKVAFSEAPSPRTDNEPIS